MAAGEDQPQPVVLDLLIVPPGGVTRIVVESLGELEVAEQADEGSEDAARLGTVDAVQHLTQRFACVLAHHLYSLVARWSLECAGDFRESLRNPQQPRFVPAFPDYLYPNRQAIMIARIRQHDGRMTAVIE